MEFVFLVIILSSIQMCYGASMQSQDCATCNAITLPLTRLGNKCYYFEIIAKANWQNANHYCNFHGMRLASIVNEEENTALGEHIKTLAGLPHEQRIWTSGTDLGGEGNWFWSAIGQRFSYTNWRHTQPDNAGNNENCLDVAIVEDKLGWNDLPCGWEIPFICEVTPLFLDARQL